MRNSYEHRNYIPDKFYNIDNINDKISFLKDCISKSYDVKIDELDCKVSYRRQISKSLKVENIFEMINSDKCVHIYYKGDDIDYFLWISMDLKHLEYFIEKYELSAKGL